MYGETILKIEGLNKSFGITHANADINLELHRGEVRALAGENGSGKSTLLSQIAGIYGSDSGTMYLNGQVYAPKSPMDANDNKIAIVVQELGLIADLQELMFILEERKSFQIMVSLITKRFLQQQMQSWKNGDYQKSISTAVQTD